MKCVFVVRWVLNIGKIVKAWEMKIGGDRKDRKELE